MSELLDYLIDPANRKTITFYAAGASVACGGIWSAIKHFTTPPNIRAQDGIAAQGDILVEGGVTIHKTTPKGPLILIGLGLVALAIGLALPRPCANEADITDSVVSCGDLNVDGDITIGGGS